MSDHLSPLWLVGAGGMARDYARVLDALARPFEIIGRGAGSADKLAEAIGRPVRQGGVEAFLATHPPASAAIVAVGVADLREVTLALLTGGVKRILVEKPAGLDRPEVGELATAAQRAGAEVYVAYNRRFYASTRRAKEIIAEDGGVTSFTFEFTEWSHEIEALPTAPRIKENWLLANSSHVIDLAFFLGGEPVQLDARVAGSLTWHPSGAVFTGSGVSTSGALFSYHANWAAPGRWGVEILTHKRRLIFRPMEKLQITKLASVAITEEPIDDARDRELKPGLYHQVAAFLGDGPSDLCTIAAHHAGCAHYERIARGS